MDACDGDLLTIITINRSLFDFPSDALCEFLVSLCLAG